MADVAFDFEAEIDAKDALRRASLKVDGTEQSASGTTRGKHNLVCRHWLKNLCMKGDRCEFLHVLDQSKMPECNNYQRNGFCNDPNCLFRHVDAGERPECQRYKLGFCRFGPLCRSRHDRLPREAIPELLPDWFIDSVLSNAAVVPRLEDVGLESMAQRAARAGRGGAGQDLSLSKSFGDEGTVPGLLPPIHGKCRYFFVRSNVVKNIHISAAKGIWATSGGNSQKFRQAFRDVDHVIIIFSCGENRSFSGYGKMSSEPDSMLFPGIWGDMSSRLSANFRVHWIKQCTTQCHTADHIKTQCQDNMRSLASDDRGEEVPVRRCRDGQELPSSVGERLCRFLWQQADVDLLRGTSFEFEPRFNYDLPMLALQDDRSNGDAAKANGHDAAAAAPALALEDADKKDSDRRRPAPEKLGSFQAKPAKTSGVSVGKALASGSSSLLAAVNEDAQRQGASGHGHWQPPTWAQPFPPHGDPAQPPNGHPSLYPQHRPDGAWMPPPAAANGAALPPPHPAGAGYHPPPHGAYYPAPGYPPGAFAPAPGLGGPPPMSPFEARLAGQSPFEASSRGPPRSPFEAGGLTPAVPPPGFWGGSGTPGSAPPEGWEGAAGPAGRSNGDRKRSDRDRSRSRRRHKEEKKKSKK
eukprot:TRINITY_DN37390_c0_g1_i1.p1 TRINITY_DN37390_c0_g1~~TRINITY_DN37390_c0_g1_i1.p1  ORF type:complete len:637 (-),score=115.43 TRINITY_DN37390_c0_g1_i1:56-1966(-)